MAPKPQLILLLGVIYSKKLERDGGGKPASTFPHPALGEAAMIKTASMALFFIAAIGIAPVRVQAGGFESIPPGEQNPAGLLNQNNLTATGKTVPHPGVSQDSGMSELDRQIEKTDDRVEQSICSNC